MKIEPGKRLVDSRLPIGKQRMPTLSRSSCFWTGCRIVQIIREIDQDWLWFQREVFDAGTWDFPACPSPSPNAIRSPNSIFIIKYYIEVQIARAAGDSGGPYW